MGVGFLIDMAPIEEIRAGEHPRDWKVEEGAGAGAGIEEVEGSSEGVESDSAAARTGFEDNETAEVEAAGFEEVEEEGRGLASRVGSLILEGREVTLIGSA